jgi:hypothetical protein
MISFLIYNLFLKIYTMYEYLTFKWSENTCSSLLLDITMTSYLLLLGLVIANVICFPSITLLHVYIYDEANTIF